jgi:hypothetical protein
MTKGRSLVISVVASMMLFSLVAIAGESRSLYSTHFVGEFTLPFTAQWGHMTLPAGNYNLYYGYMGRGGIYAVEVANEDTGIHHGWIFPRGIEAAKGEGSFLVCIRDGDKGYVRSLQMAELGESIEFARPHGVSVDAWIVAAKKTHNTKTALAEMRIPIVPVK